MDRDPTIEFRILGYTPDTLPLGRLGEYLIQLATLYGSPQSVHFDRVTKGSAVLRSRVDAAEFVPVLTRLRQVKTGGADEGAQRAYAKINSMLATNMAWASVRTKVDGQVLQFPGAKIIDPVPIVVEDFAEVEGIVVRVGGIDQTIPVHLQGADGTVYLCQVRNRGLAQQFATMLYGDPVRVGGNGQWERSADGKWKLLNMTITGWVALDADTPEQVFEKAKSIPGNGWKDVGNVATEIHKLRHGE